MSVKEEEDSEHDIFAVSFEKAGMIVGHVEVSTRHGGSIICEVTGHRRLGRAAWIDHATINFGRGQHLCVRALNKECL